MLTTKKQITATVIEKTELPDDLLKASEKLDVDKWAFASVEVTDREGDIVRVEGIDFSSHTDAHPLKILCNHDRKLTVDGYPVVGKAVTFQRTAFAKDGENCPALVFGMKFAPTDFGQRMKKLYDGKFLTDFSIGADSKPGGAAALKGGGVDWKATTLNEVSACVFGMNQHAKTIERALDVEDEMATATLKPDARPDKILLLLNEQATLLKQITSRLDDIESIVVAKSDATAEQTGDQNDQQATVDDKANDEIAKALSHLSSLLNK